MSDSDLKITLFGGFSNFTYCALKHLIESNLCPQRLVISAYGPSEIPSVELSETLFQSANPGIIELSDEYGIPITYGLQQDLCLEGILSEHPSDIFLLACYPKFLPVAITSILTVDCINIHPSLLPRYKGANPIFWQLRNGETETGVTLHQVTSEIDGGNILTARKIAYPDGCRIGKIEDTLVGSAIEALKLLLYQNRSEWISREQDATQATRQRTPCDDDFVINATWRSKTAWNFVRAYAGTSRPIKYIDQSEIYWIDDALEYRERRRISGKSVRKGTVLAEFVDGYAVFTVENLETKNL